MNLLPNQQPRPVVLLSVLLATVAMAACMGEANCPRGLVAEGGACIDPSTLTSAHKEVAHGPDAGSKQARTPGDAGPTDDAGIDAGPPTCFPDADNDGHGAQGQPVPCDTIGVALVTLDDDCNEADRTIFGASAELCDGLDNDCDGKVDEDMRPLTFYADHDGDGYGVADETVSDCKPPEGYAIQVGDCDDESAGSFPDNVEACDGADNDCDGKTDEGLLNVCGRCGEAPKEVCNGLDDNCDGAVDEGALNDCGGCTPLDYPRGDACTLGLGQCQIKGKWQCTDANHITCGSDIPAPGPVAEQCNNGIDDDCDGWVDESDRYTERYTWYCDGDDDGYATLTQKATKPACDEPPPEDGCKGWTKIVPQRDLAAGVITADCDDTSFRHHPGALPQGVPETSLWTPREDLDCNTEVAMPLKIDDAQVGIHVTWGAIRYLPACNASRACDCARYTDTAPRTCHTVEAATVVINGFECSILSGSNESAPAEYCTTNANGKATWTRNQIGFRTCR